MYIILDCVYIYIYRRRERDIKVASVFKTNFVSFLLPKTRTKNCALNKKKSLFANDYFVLRADSVNLNMTDKLSSKELPKLIFSCLKNVT